MNKQLILFLAVLTVLFSCKKEEIPESHEGLIEFELRGQLSGQEFLMQAGIDGYFMYSDFYNPVNSNQLGYYSGKMKQYENEDANESIEIRIENIRPGAISDSNLVSILNRNSLTYKGVTAEETYYEVAFHAAIENEVISYLWDFGDGNTSGSSDPIHIYSDITTPKYNVCLTVTYLDNCSNTICSDVFMPNASCSANMSIQGVTDSLPGPSFQFEALENGKSPYTYLWEINNIVYTTKNPYVSYSPAANPIDYVNLTVTDGNNCISKIAKYISVFGLPRTCMINFYYDAPVLKINAVPDMLPNVEVIYKNSMGTSYSSLNAKQDLTSLFNILMSESYKKNERGQKTKKVDIAFSCLLDDINGNTIKMENVRGRIALAYP